MRLALFILFLAATLWAAGIKLVLKDGTYQMVRSYEIKGDRVRFFSLERNDWEEMPASLVDWKATEAAKHENKDENIEKAREVMREEAAEPKAGEGPEVAPGVRIPGDWGAYALVENKVVTLPTSKAGAHMDMKRTAVNVMIPVPVLKNRKFVVLPGAKAQTELAQAPQALFVTGRASPTSRFALLRLKVKENTRQLEAISISLLGKASHEGNQVDISTEPVNEETVKLIPKQPLAAGEYAIVEFLDNNLNLYVWDFGVAGK